jgi:hypothetical protein
MPNYTEPVTFSHGQKVLIELGEGSPAMLGTRAKIELGAKGGEGGVLNINGGTNKTFQLDGMYGGMLIWRPGHGDHEIFRIDANKSIMTLGSEGVTRFRVDGSKASIVLGGDDGKETVRIDGVKGDIVLANADCAEDFEIDQNAEVEPGSVLVISEAGRLRPADQTYDRRVAGVVAGAGGLRPGVVLGRHASGGPAVPVSLAGRVYCKVDATDQPIKTGDLLTTSGIPGHAMAAVDPARAFGSVLGKALQPLGYGLALIPILVSLQ